MKTKKSILVTLVLVFGFFGIPTSLGAVEPIQPTVVITPPVESATDVWIDKLELCESGGNPMAINQRDLDGTPSYGAFQFKPGTFTSYAKAYGVAGALMNESAQREIVFHMTQDSSTNWHWQFPDCTKKLGLPP